MKLRNTLAALSLTLAGVAVPLIGVTDTAHAGAATPSRHACTHTSSGTCIRGGEFCPQASYGHSGWDAVGRRYVCKGDHTHPHWMVP